VTETETKRCPTSLSRREFTPTQRMALLVLWFSAGQHLSTTDVAMAFGITVEGARVMLNRLSGAIPLVRENERGRWYLL